MIGLCIHLNRFDPGHRQNILHLRTLTTKHGDEASEEHVPKTGDCHKALGDCCTKQDVHLRCATNDHTIKENNDPQPLKRSYVGHELFHVWSPFGVWIMARASARTRLLRISQPLVYLGWC